MRTFPAPPTTSEPTAEERIRAARVVSTHAHDPDDRTQLLSMLGLLPIAADPVRVPHRRRESDGAARRCQMRHRLFDMLDIDASAAADRNGRAR